MRGGTQLVLGFWLCCFWALGCGSSPSPEPLPTPVVVKPIEAYKGGTEVQYSATIKPHAKVELAFKVGGYLQELLQVRGVDGELRTLQAGDRVTKGTVLAHVRKIDYQNTLAQAHSRLNAAKAKLEYYTSELQRARNLFATNSLTKSDYDKVKAGYQEAEAQVAEATAMVNIARTNLQDTALKAPMSGLVLQRLDEVGDLISPGRPSLVLADTTKVKVIFGVSDLMLKQLEIGSFLTVTTEALRGREFRGRVTNISPSADPKSRIFEVEISIPNHRQELKVGMITSVTVPIEKAQKPIAVVPLSAIVRSKSNPKGYALFVIQEKDNRQTACLRDNVNLGEVYGNSIAVVRGIKIGEPVVVTGATLLEDGQTVRMIPPHEP